MEVEHDNEWLDEQVCSDKGYITKRRANMRETHTKIMQGDHAAIAFKGKPMTLDEAIIELNMLYEIGNIVDETQELNMSNYDEGQVDDLNNALVQIHKLVFREKSIHAKE